jgi:MoaA/NifB/PqqE/SkfB family radical SAM enzyme
VTTPFDFIVDDHFRPLTRRQDAVDLFMRSVTMVEIETFSYCNRRCWFCPNSVVDRHSSTEYMDEALYLRVIGQLAEVGYDRMISYSRYNEPLSDRIILTRLAQARAALPHALLHTNTNGDYLTRGYLEDLHAAGLRSLNIQIYLANQERYDHERMRAKLMKAIAALGLNAVIVRDEPGVWLEATALSADMRIRLYARNFDVNGCNRGDTVPIEVAARRTSPCLSPFYHVYIDYNGSVMPCCNLRSDVPSHATAVVANLHQRPDLFLVYAGQTLASWRRSLVGFEPKGGHCAGCSFVPFADTVEHRAVHDALAATAASYQPAHVA